MRVLEWEDGLMVGNSTVDSEHRELMELVNELHEYIHDTQLLGKNDPARLTAVFNKVLGYTQAHFKHEEQMFEGTDYPNADSHKREHKALSASIMGLNDRVNATNSYVIAIELLALLKEWLMTHIQRADLRMTAYLDMKAEEA